MPLPKQPSKSSVTPQRPCQGDVAQGPSPFTSVTSFMGGVTSSQLLWGALGILGLWLGFPNALGHIPFMVLLYPLALQQLGSQASAPVQALRHGWITGLLGAFAALYWLSIPIKNVGGLPWALAIPCAMGMGAYIGLYGALFSVSSFYAQRHMAHAPLRRMLLLACLWYGLELLRNVAFTGFPWLTLSAAFAPYPLLTQGASVVGAYALSGMYVLLILSTAHALQDIRTKQNHTDKQSLKAKIPALVLALVLSVCLLSYGFSKLSPKESTAEQATAFPVLMVEGNIDQNVKWDADIQRATLQIYMNLSRQGLQHLRKEDASAQALLLWPETAMPFFLESHPVLGRKLLHFVKNVQSPLVVGAPALNKDPLGQNRPFNRAYSIGENAQLFGYYDKVHLVPFGEYVPSWLQWNFLEGLLQSIGAFSAGTQQSPLKSTLLKEDGTTLNLALGALICYEGIFPELAQKRVELGANVLVNMSNDGWFGHSAAPQQHLQLALMRAVEQGRWLIRNTNTGISAIIDAHGRIRLQGEQFHAQYLLGKAQLRQGKTFFHTFYEYIPWAILSIALFCLLSVVVKRQFFLNNKDI